MYISFDIGGTTTRFAKSLDGQTVADVKTEPTPQKYEDAMQSYQKIIADFADGQPIDGLAGGLPGTLDPDKTMLVSAPHLTSWVNKPIVDRFKSMAHCPVFIENDTSLAALGEAVRGAGSKYKIVAYLGLGTGVGGARVVNQTIDANSIGFEPGRMIISGGKTLEQLISGTAITQKYNKKASDITDENFWHEFEQYLVMGLNNITALWSPDIIVLGGGVAINGQVLPDRIMIDLYKTLTIYPKLPRVIKAQLGDHSGIEGGLVYLKQKLNI